MNKPIKIIDLFAGPGGLGEGFSAYTDEQGRKPFKIAISIEKEVSAHATLTLRAFFRQFNGNPPEEYYDFLKGKLGKTPEEHLYKLPKFKKEVENARQEALQLTLGEDNSKINRAIRKAIGDDECILIGGPPCQAYSLAGRSRNMGIQNYKAENDHRNFLYLEYLKVIARFQPRIFVMENVKGMLSAKINGAPIIDDIMDDLQNPCRATGTYPDAGRYKRDYKVFSFVSRNGQSNLFSENRDPSEYIIRAENYGIPQKRHRVILLGIRDDLAEKWCNSLLLEKYEPFTSIKDILKDLPKLRSGLSKEENSDENWAAAIRKAKKHAIPSLRKAGKTDQAKYMNKVASNIVPLKNGQGSCFGLRKTKDLKISNNKPLESWLKDLKLNNYVCNHETKKHITSDLYRYLFCSTWAKLAEEKNWKTKFPKSKDYTSELAPQHANFSSGVFTDRFRVQIENEPATTVTSHISKDGHYFIHPDPYQCRSLTVREAARIQTFPDNYFFSGNRTQQYVQVGNAVPPFLALQLAKITFKILK